jgi:outer membrane protein assembly factor BamB
VAWLALWDRILIIEDGQFEFLMNLPSIIALFPIQRQFQSARRSIAHCLLAALLSTALSPVMAGDWPQWRGPYFNGSGEKQPLPSRFSQTENLRWSVQLPGAAAATPIVWGDRVFISSTDERAQTLLAMCFDARTGRLLWERKTGDGVSRDRRSNYAAPSPLTDGERVWFFYSNGQLVCFDFDGQELWARNIQEEYGQFAFLWTFSSSPLLFQDRLYLQVLQRDVPVGGRGFQDRPNESYLLALNPKTGSELWRHIRPSRAREESREAFSTPIPFKHNDRAEILITGGDAISGHDPATGREFWRWGTWNPTRINHWRLVPSPVTGPGVVVVCAPKGGPVFAVKAGGQGELPDSALAWQSQDREVSSDVPTPLLYRDRFYVLNRDRKSISCVEPRTGHVFWTGDLESRPVFESSPTAADGKIYFMNHQGEAFVVAAQDDSFQLLHRVQMGGRNDDSVRSSIAIARGNLFIRTDRMLYCIGEEE